MACAESLRVQAHFDGEIDAVSAAQIEEHISNCAECRALLQDLEQTRAAILENLTVDRAPQELRAWIAHALDRESVQPSTPKLREKSSWRTRPFWIGALGGIGASAAAATIAFMVMSSSLTKPLLDEVVAAHVRSLMPGHLIDVVSTDQHTVKPWFAGHADVSPVVADFRPQGYELVGGRADYLDHQRSAVVVYRHGRHIINVFSWAGRGRSLPRSTTRNGYHMACWSATDLGYCAVSDTGWDELRGLVRLLEDRDATPGQKKGIPTE